MPGATRRLQALDRPPKALCQVPVHRIPHRAVTEATCIVLWQRGVHGRKLALQALQTFRGGAAAAAESSLDLREEARCHCLAVHARRSGALRSAPPEKVPLRGPREAG